MTKHIITSITINASKEKVWEVFTDFDNYPKWNPFITSITGKAEVGSRITINLQGITFKPVILTFNKNSELKWLGNLWFKGLFDGEHKFCLKDNGDGTTDFEQSETFNGILLRLFSNSLDKKTKKGFEQMNEQLKFRVKNVK